MSIKAIVTSISLCCILSFLFFTFPHEIMSVASEFLQINKRNESKKCSPSGGLEPPTFRLTVERASQLRHEGCVKKVYNIIPF